MQNLTNRIRFIRWRIKYLKLTEKNHKMNPLVRMPKDFCHRLDRRWSMDQSIGGNKHIRPIDTLEYGEIR